MIENTSYAKFALRHKAVMDKQFAFAVEIARQNFVGGF